MTARLDTKSPDPKVALAGPEDAPSDNWGDVQVDADGPWFELGDLVADAEPVAPEPPAAQAPPEPARRPEPAATPQDPPPAIARDLTPDAAPALLRQPAQAPPEAFFDAEPEPFAHYRRVQKLGIIGGKGVGKSYLFQAMVYRVQNARRSGALSYFLDGAGTELVRTLARDARARTVNLQRFNGDYERWTRLGTTLAANQPWYRLTLPYRTGLLGLTRAAMEVEFFDGSGEQFFEAKDPRNRDLWELAYGDARVLAFCLPLWALFPAPDQAAVHWRERDSLLDAFHEVVQNYRDMRRRLGRRQPVRSILALTMADDRRCGLEALRDTWIGGYLQGHQAFLAETRTGRGIARYLANTRRVSRILLETLMAAPSPGVAGIPDLLAFGAGPPWLIPVSAIHGEALDQLERDYPDPDTRPARPPPVPAHVELPLLVALCEYGNALM